MTQSQAPACRVTQAALQNLLQQLDWQKQQQLIPVVVQNYHSAKVLMLGYMNQEALQASVDKGLVTFYSRSKQRLWTKGETSGNHLQLVSIAMDCDNDALLVQAVPVGPTCHKGTESCWDGEVHPFIHQLQSLIHGRKHADPATSYTASLFARGTKRISQKVGEEGLETALAAATHDKPELVNEASDLLYHLLVLLEDQELSLADINANLALRHQQAEK
ncbi:bifunctional phosphoribosyl-AMP cyclohydrolase/phosphoribosyl-ATP diphosphatase HisIE [Shewanella sp. YIC-542]|uniref:bifunctional phosphoribosyl-AMP cyclohydrolase/phosphoribosyl-ATP diphosphatase HisIE n=1 Tax=Shewanella mytili TaxID=3377111 RepID=UPI00398EA642